MASIARAKPGYVDQVPRRLAFERNHPDVRITYHGPHWEARIPHDAGETVINRYELRVLLDKLEQLTADDAKPGSEGQDLPVRGSAAAPAAHPAGDRPESRTPHTGPADRAGSRTGG